MNNWPDEKLDVFCRLRASRFFVGRLADNQGDIVFEYDKDFLAGGIELSPFKLPLRPGLHKDAGRTFKGLPGLFNDSLPDGWGLLLLDRFLRKQGLDIQNISPLKRLSALGAQGMGALEYAGKTDDKTLKDDLPVNFNGLDGLDEEIRAVLAEGETDLQTVADLMRLGGSSGGARPKILVDVSNDGSQIWPEARNKPGFSPWLIKFQAGDDDQYQGLIEYVYSLMAKQAGLEMPETRLFPSKNSAGFFGVKRFDRQNGQKIHVHTAAGLLHASHRHPTLDYENLIRLTKILSKGNRQEIQKMVRLMVFNVKTGNRDDHSKNFSFLLDENRRWKMAPAYDLTPSPGFNGEHSAMVNGQGKNITDADLVAAAKIGSVSPSFVYEAIKRTEEVFSHFETLKTKCQEATPGQPGFSGHS